MSTNVTFNPATDPGMSSILTWAATRTEIVDDSKHADPATESFVTGGLESEGIFAMAVTGAVSPADAVRRIQSALMLKLGLLPGDNDIERQRLRGWIAGLIGNLAESLEPTD